MTLERENATDRRRRSPLQRGVAAASADTERPESAILADASRACRRLRADRSRDGQHPIESCGAIACSLARLPRRMAIAAQTRRKGKAHGTARDPGRQQPHHFRRSSQALAQRPRFVPRGNPELAPQSTPWVGPRGACKADAFPQARSRAVGNGEEVEFRSPPRRHRPRASFGRCQRFDLASERKAHPGRQRLAVENLGQRSPADGTRRRVLVVESTTRQPRWLAPRSRSMGTLTWSNARRTPSASSACRPCGWMRSPAPSGSSVGCFSNTSIR
ncbi:hypothetical protein E5CHR_01460 [Variovorax sp. PBL-E5]|nr:hypothetical protein E5CHR_01460 [Variovorax sp. PBL-E5]